VAYPKKSAPSVLNRQSICGPYPQTQPNQVRLDLLRSATRPVADTIAVSFSKDSIFAFQRRTLLAKATLSEIAKDMAGIEVTIMSTHTESGGIANRPMSNNGDVTYDGTSFYFSYEQASAVSDIERAPKVALGFSSEAGLFSQGIYVAVEGTAELIRDKAAFKQHWTRDLDKWFDQGVDTPGIVLIKVKANRVTYWKGRDEGEVEI